LFLNAVTHGFAEGQSGTITLTARERNPREVDIEFSDDGVGMNPEVQRQAFDPFFTTKRNKGGTGLGLHIVYNLVTQQLDGRLHLETVEGRGTSIKITLPKTAWPRVGPPTPTTAGTSNVR
jgi:signal transduction histidine kinase